MEFRAFPLWRAPIPVLRSLFSEENLHTKVSATGLMIVACFSCQSHGPYVQAQPLVTLLPRPLCPLPFQRSELDVSVQTVS